MKLVSPDPKQIAQLERLMQSRWGIRKFRASKPAEIVAFFSGMPEDERRTFVPVLKQWYKDYVNSQTTFDLRRLWAGLFATATLSELKKMRWWFADDTACAVLADRKVPWLAEWAELALEKTSSSNVIGGVVVAIRGLVQQGLIGHPEHDNYAIGAAFAVGVAQLKDEDSRGTLAEQLATELPEWGDVIWRQFEVEGGGEISLANFEKYGPSGVEGTWAYALKSCSEDGLLDRGRLLNASLDALNRGFSQYRAGWFSRFHEFMEPTLEERAARADRYLGLLDSPIGPTVSLAMAALAKLQKAKLLDTDLVIDHIEPALYAQAAKTAKAGLTLLANAAKASTGRRAEALQVAAISLEHPKIEIQEQGFSVLETYADELDSAAIDAVSKRLEVMSATVRSRAQALVAPGEDAAGRQPAGRQDTTELVADANRLPADLRHLAGIDAALAALEAGADDISAAPFNGMDVPRLDPASAIIPIATFEELIDEALVSIEHSGELDRVERVLAGALRFAAERPANEAELLAPLTRSLKRFNVNSYYGYDWLTPRGALQVVLSAFVANDTVDPLVTETDPCAVMVLRARAMAEAIATRQPRQQYSAPTHQGYWIDCRVLVERTRLAADNAIPTLSVADQCLALLRLAPDYRQEALAAAQGLEGEWASALRYALGGNELIGKTLSLWVAAVRARSPFADDESIVALSGLSRHGEHLAPALTYLITWDFGRHENPLGKFKISCGFPGDDGVDFGKESWVFVDKEKPPKHQPDPARCLPTVGLSDPQQLRKLDTYISGDLAHLTGSWAPAVWPQHPEPLFALSVKAGCMLDGIIGFEPATEPLADGLILIHDPDVPVGPMAVLMLARGLNALDKAAAQATVDALIAVIQDGRLDGHTFGTTMHELLMGGIIVAKRWPSHLRDIARASPLHAMVIRKALQRAVYPGEPQRPLRNMHAWLEVLHELSVEAGEAIEDAQACDGLIVHFKTGQAKKLAKVLLDLKSSDSTDHRTAAIALALEHRITRAERWAAWAG